MAKEKTESKLNEQIQQNQMTTKDKNKLKQKQFSENDLDWRSITQRLESMATSEKARSRLRELQVCRGGPSEAQLSFREIEEAQSLLALGGERPFMESLDTFPLWSTRLARKAVLQPLELRDVRHFCTETVALSEVLMRHREQTGSRSSSSSSSPSSLSSWSWCDRMLNRLMSAMEPLTAIDQIMTPSGEIRTDASPTLDRLYREKQNQTRNLQNTLDRLIKARDMEDVVQEKYVTTREGRWVIPVRSGMQHAFPGIIHTASQSKQTVFMEPDEVIPLNNRIREIDSEIEAEIERLLTELSEYLQSQLNEFENTSEAMLDSDVRLAQAKLTESLGAHAVQFTDEILDLRELRHPLLVLQNTPNRPVIPNSVELNPERRILLLSGPNAGGKTVLLKAIGLAAQMARCGLPVCAEEGSKLPFFEHIHVGVGDAQSVDQHLSTFAAHLEVLSQGLELRGPKNLVLIDEICGSTDPEEGSALARSFIEHYCANDIYAVITSHLGPLKLGWSSDSGVINGSLESSHDSGRPLYHFLMGVPGQSAALATARRVGVPDSVVSKALDYMSPEAQAQHRGLAEIDDLKLELSRLKKEMVEETHRVREHKKVYLTMIQKFRQEKDEWIARSVKKAEKKLDEWIEKARVQQVFQRHDKRTLSSDMSSSLGLPYKAAKASDSMIMRKSISTQEEFEKVFGPGSKVFIPQIGQDGIVQGKANGKGEVPILSNSMHLYVLWSDLRPPQGLSNPTQNILRRASSGLQTQWPQDERVVDVRGMRVEEAIGKIEVALDAAQLADESRVKIIHGHGTEALKRSIRMHLSRSIYVKKWTSASVETGGDGVTWAELKD